MPLKITTNKFRHVFGQSTRKDSCFENIHITKNAHDSNFAAVNPKFMAVVLDGVGGGAFLVHSINQVSSSTISHFTIPYRQHTMALLPGHSFMWVARCSTKFGVTGSSVCRHIQIQHSVISFVVLHQEIS